MIEHFIMPDDGPLLRLPRSVVEQLMNRRARLPQYAGIKVRCVQVLMEIDEAGAPRGVVRVIPYYLTLDHDGYEDVQASVDAAFYLWNKSAEEAEETDIVDLQKQKERREHDKLYRWEITPAQMQRITEAALGHPRAIKKVKSFKTPPPKKVESWPAEKAMREMSEPVWKLNFAMDDMDEEDLTVLADLIQEKAKDDSSMAPVWNGLRDVCLRDREIKRLYRTGEGAWWAIVEMIKWTEPREGKSLHHWAEKCETREAAADKAREIALANTHLIESDMTIEVRVYADLEHVHELD